ncbi:glycosyltransferase family 2 protein [Lactococcus cremoris]|uniref:glycosyltransferase family 2 protein n=1 Tax=Lactococcus lactis subsp. cremoris TaxID=1359 RepID=UPI002871B21E|nr:glycosyltransferase family 2 protein [Lactococcus cremoris]MDR9868657.1 glycosyltransferase family 2 protein [Lactococcus cremoris]
MNFIQTIMILAIISIWIATGLGLMILFSATHFWLTTIKKERQKVFRLATYPKITIVVPAHNEEVVIAQTIESIMNLNYPKTQLELLLYADNCQDDTYNQIISVVSLEKYKHISAQVIQRTGTGGKAGVLNDALSIATGEWICVYDADAMPEKNALHFLVEKALENPEKYGAVFGRNKTRNYKQNFLTRCINLEIVNTQRIHHVGLWHLFKIGRIPGTNFIIKTDFVKHIGGWDNGALTEDTAISFKIMQSGKLIALAHNSEAFQQEPETVSAYYHQRKRWAKGNYQVILDNFKHLFDRSVWRIKWEVFYYISTFFWFNAAIVISDIIFVANIVTWGISMFNPSTHILFIIGSNNIELANLLMINWFLMVGIYLLQINIALASQFGQLTVKNLSVALISYVTYAQLFIVVSVVSVVSVLLDHILHRDGTKWYKTKRFGD